MTEKFKLFVTNNKYKTLFYNNVFPNVIVYWLDWTIFAAAYVILQSLISPILNQLQSTASSIA